MQTEESHYTDVELADMLLWIALQTIQAFGLVLIFWAVLPAEWALALTALAAFLANQSLNAVTQVRNTILHSRLIAMMWFSAQMIHAAQLASGKGANADEAIQLADGQYRQARQTNAVRFGAQNEQGLGARLFGLVASLGVLAGAAACGLLASNWINDALASFVDLFGS